MRLPSGAVGRRVRPTALTAFLAALAVILAVYTVLAFDMEWRATAGRLGAGFFPRVIGVLGVVLCCVAAVRSLRPPPPRRDLADGVDANRKITAEGDAPAGDAADEAEVQGEDVQGDGVPGGGHPWTLLATLAGMAAFLFLLVPLGAFLTSGLVMFALLELLGRGHLARNAAISVLVPVILYVIFEVLLDAGLPMGPLPLS
jgi:putative tricarboxylic transport membrane protein